MYDFKQNWNVLEWPQMLPELTCWFNVLMVCLSDNDGMHPADSFCLRKQVWRRPGSLGLRKVPFWKVLDQTHTLWLFSLSKPAERLFWCKFTSTLTHML